MFPDDDPLSDTAELDRGLKLGIGVLELLLAHESASWNSRSGNLWICITGGRDSELALTVRDMGVFATGEAGLISGETPPNPFFVNSPFIPGSMSVRGIGDERWQRVREKDLCSFVAERIAMRCQHFAIDNQTETAHS